MPKVWGVRANGGAFTQACVDAGLIGIGWEFVGDLSGVANKEHLRERYERRSDREEGRLTVATNVSTVWRFVSEINKGDWIITPAVNRKELRFGKVVGNYRWAYEPSASIRYRHVRDVEWSPRVLDRHSLSLGFQNTLGSGVTVFNVRHVNEFLEKIGEPIAGPIRRPPDKEIKPFELAIDKVLELSPTDFEHLVGHLLRAIGFEIDVTQPVGDEGVDFRGTLHVASAAQIKIIGQVKRYKRGSNITGNPIRDLRGRIPIGEQGTFVTTSDYTKKAREIATEEGFARVGLINGEQLVDLLTQHWHDIPDEFRNMLGLKPILVPA